MRVSDEGVDLIKRVEKHSPLWCSADAYDASGEKGRFLVCAVVSCLNILRHTGRLAVSC